MKTKTLTLEEALGLPLSHDLTQISPEKGFKGARFKKGHLLTAEDLQTLRSMGKEHLTVLELEEGDVHEDDAALRLGKVLQGPGTELQGPGEGKCSLLASHPGVFLMDSQGITGINQDPQWVVATLPPCTPVQSGDVVGAFRVLPLVVKEEQVERAVALGKPFSVVPYRSMKVGLVTTGRELAEGRIKDAFRPKLEEKIAPYGSILVAQAIVSDEKEFILNAIDSMMEKGADMVVCTGGMSVDADDVTSSAIRERTTEIFFKGLPVLPGCHLMAGRNDQAYILGVPAGAVFKPWTSLDLLLPRLFADVPPAFEETRAWGVGGLRIRQR